MITWYAAYTQANAETKAAEHLQRQGYLAYLPRYRRHVRHARRQSLVLRPLFPRYLFVGIDRLVQRWRPVRSTVGMVGLVACAEEPVPVAAAIVAVLRAQESDGAFDLLSPTQRLRAGDDIRVTQGPFADLIGRLLGVADHERVFVLLDLLGRSVRAEVAALAVEPA
ncbi:MAG TPA: transcription termination/antitermination NusG family protein [Stellaceae bacterium]|nr:transcription termination/antitermination NusG family protein [Stellaceae bacterium]